MIGVTPPRHSLGGVTGIIVDPIAVSDPAAQAEALGVIRAAEARWRGQAETTAELLAEEFAGPKSEPGLCLIARDADGPAAVITSQVYAEVRDVHIAVSVRPGAAVAEIADRLLEEVEERTDELLPGWEERAMAASPPPQVSATVPADARGDDPVWDPNPDIWQYGSGVEEEDEELAAALRARGFRPARRFWFMQIDFDEAGAPDPDPAAPAGVEIVKATDPEELRALHEVVTESFADHWGESPQGLAEYLEAHRSLPGHDPGLWWLAMLDGRPAAACIQSRGKEPIGYGYVDTLGVAAWARGRGLAKYLLRLAFADCARRGLAGCILEVDAESPTHADELYRSVGMAPKATVDAYLRPVAT